mmetsp:Transcript_36509/g.86471  ORF Transcript_36509/g.86471 Transcript_36509/m.86471 type:complete len:112 (-) Transcript_36509:180-515(-)
MEKIAALESYVAALQQSVPVDKEEQVMLAHITQVLTSFKTLRAQTKIAVRVFRKTPGPKGSPSRASRTRPRTQRAIFLAKARSLAASPLEEQRLCSLSRSVSSTSSGRSRS